MAEVAFNNFLRGLGAGRQIRRENRLEQLGQSLQSQTNAPGANALLALGRIGQGLQFQGQQADRTARAEKDKQARMRDFGIRAAKFAQGIESLPEDQREGAHLAGIGPFVQEGRDLGLDVDETFDADSNRALAAQLGPVPGAGQGERLVQTIGPDGKPVFTPQSQAAGKQAFSAPLVTINQAKAPSGFTFKDPSDPSKGVDPLKGGPADPKRPELRSKASSALLAFEQQASVVDQNIDLAIKQIDEAVIPVTGIFSLAEAVPGTPQFDLATKLETIRSNIGFDKLQDMRANSPTGGALGQVSNLENQLLQAVQGSLKQGQTAKQLKRNLLRIKKLRAELMKERKKAFEKDFGGGQTAQPAPATKRFIENDDGTFTEQ